MIEFMATLWVYFSIGTFIGILSLKYVPIPRDKDYIFYREEQIFRLFLCIILWPLTMFFYTGLYLFDIWDKKQ